MIYHRLLGWYVLTVYNSTSDREYILTISRQLNAPEEQGLIKYVTNIIERLHMQPPPQTNEVKGYIWNKYLIIKSLLERI